MILSDRDIRSALESGKIKVEPSDGLEKRIGPDGIDMRLGTTFLVFERNKQAFIDLRKPNTAKGMTPQVDIGHV